MTKLISWLEIPIVDFNRAIEFYLHLLKIEFKAHDLGEEKMAYLPGEEGAIILFTGI